MRACARASCPHVWGHAGRRRASGTRGSGSLTNVSSLPGRTEAGQEEGSGPTRGRSHGHPARGGRPDLPTCGREPRTHLGTGRLQPLSKAGPQRPQWSRKRASRHREALQDVVEPRPRPHGLPLTCRARQARRPQGNTVKGAGELARETAASRREGLAANSQRKGDPEREQWGRAVTDATEKGSRHRSGPTSGTKKGELTREAEGAGLRRREEPPRAAGEQRTAPADAPNVRHTGSWRLTMRRDGNGGRENPE